MANEPRLTPWGDPMPSVEDLMALKAGDGIYHDILGLGLVRIAATKTAPAYVNVQFQWRGTMWLNVTHGKLCRMPPALEDLCRRQASLGVGHTIFHRERQHELLLQLLAPYAEKLREKPVVVDRQLPSLPVELRPVAQRARFILPWVSASPLVGPMDATWAAHGRYASGKARHARRIVFGADMAAPFPLFICSAMPPFKRLHHWLTDTVVAMHSVGPQVAADIIACWALGNTTDGCVVDLTDAVPGGMYRYGTRLFLNVMRQRLVDATQQLRAVSHENGRWWPAPERIQVLLNANGTITARMRFAQGFRRTDREWLEVTGDGGWR